MNDTLNILSNAYLEGGTGSIMLYYDFLNTGRLGFLTGAGDDYFITLTTLSTFSNGELDITSNETINLFSGSSLIGSYALDTPGNTNTDIENGLDPSDDYLITVDSLQDGSDITIKTDLTGVVSGTVTETVGVDDVINDSQEFAVSIDYSGFIKNVSPSSTVGTHDAYFTNTDYSESSKNTLTGSAIPNDISGYDLTLSNLSINDFSGEGFLLESDLNSESSFLFSFEKTKNTNGILFGCLNKFEYSDSNNDFSYGRGFNIGLTDRNKLFFQGIDAQVGEYVVVADDLELSSKNICSAVVSPYSVKFSLYNLTDDEFYEQVLRTDSKIQNNGFGTGYYLGGSNVYLRTGETFSGYLDEFMLISGNISSSDLKSIASGFVATGIPTSGSSFDDQIVTGHEISLITPVGVTGYKLVPTGYQEVVSQNELIEFVLVENPSPYSRNDGERFLTGYSLPNLSGYYLEETSFLIPETDYNPTGDDAFATLGLIDSSDVVTRYTIETTKLVNVVSGVTLYDIEPITGILIGEPTGYSKTDLINTISKTGSIVESLSFKEGYMYLYKPDYVHYLDRRI